MFYILILFNFWLATAAVDPSQILMKSDRARGAAMELTGLTWVADVNVRENDSSNEAVYSIKVKKENALAEVIEPKRRKKELTLFNDRNLWFMKPGLKKPVSISPRQKLMGQASNGDIASTHYARDYTPTLKLEETKNGVPCYLLELQAKAKNVTYDKINYWISKKENLGVFAEFMTVSGEKFKSASFEYKNKLVARGEQIPFVSEMKITDAHNPSNVTIIRYKEPKEVSLPDAAFNVNNLTR